MISVRDVVFALLHAPVIAVLPAVGAAFGIQRGHSGPGEIEMIRAVVETALGSRFRDDRTVLRDYRVSQVVFEFAAAMADDDHVAHPPPGIQGVHIDVRHGGFDRIDRVFHIPLGTEQAGFFGCNGQKDDGAFGWRGLFQMKFGEREQRGGTRRIIHCAVPDVVAFHVGHHAEMVPMGGINDGLIGTRRAGNCGDDVL